MILPTGPSGRRNLSALKEAVRWKYAWPGGYPLSAITTDGAALCMECVRKNWRNVAQETLHPSWSCGWGVAAVDILWEGGNCCDNCGECLDAYPSEEEEEQNQ